MGFYNERSFRRGTKDVQPAGRKLQSQSYPLLLLSFQLMLGKKTFAKLLDWNISVLYKWKRKKFYLIFILDLCSWNFSGFYL